MIEEIDKQLEEMEDELAKLSNALELINDSKQAIKSAADALASAQAGYSTASKNAAQALRNCSKQLSLSSSQLLDKIEPLVDEIKNSELGKCNEGIQDLEKKIERLASSEQLQAVEASQIEAIQAVGKQIEEAHSSQRGILQTVETSLEAQRARLDRIEKIALAAVCAGGMAFIAAVIGIFL